MLDPAPESTAGAAESSPGAALLAWYESGHRQLPWRDGGDDPYAIWVSEVMLQQTRVETVRPRFLSFVARFPDVMSLASASTDEVLREWSGLGYYRRARQLHAAAQEIVTSRGGALPSRAAQWRELRGVGDYTAAAIAAIAFGEAVAVVDGNVERVVSRLLALEEDPKRAVVRRRIRDFVAAKLLVPGRSGDSNQAVMELGATVCLPLKPRCARCPLGVHCLALLAPRGPAAFPIRRRRAAPQRVPAVAALVGRREDDRYLLFRRPADEALLAGFWEVPWVETADGAKTETESDLEKRYGGEFRLGEVLGEARHGITFRDLRVRVHRAEWSPVGRESAVAEGLEAGWFDEDDRRRLPRSALLEKVLRAAKTAGTVEGSADRAARTR